MTLKRKNYKKLKLKFPLGFFYKKRWYPIKWVNDKPLKHRVETLILQNDKIFLCYTSKNKVPGGRIEVGNNIISEAAKEVREEAKMNITNVKYYGIYYIEKYSAKKKRKQKKNNKPVIFNGSYNHVCIGLFHSKYTGFIHKKDLKEEFCKKGKFYKIDEVYKHLRDEHKQALDLYLNRHKPKIK